MKRLKVLSQERIELEEVSMEISSCLLSGGVLVYPSDTVYGIMCRARDEGAVTRVRRLKGYREKRPFILLVGGLAMARELGSGLTEPVLDILRSRWPGKFTAVVRASGACPEWVQAAEGTVALRHPADELSRLVLERMGEPLVSTSANAAGSESPLAPEDIPPDLAEGVDLFIDSGRLPVSSPSEVVLLTGPEPRTLRG